MESHPELQALRQEVERLRSLHQHNSGLLDAVLTQTPHGIIICDGEGKLIHDNAAARAIWAGSADADSVAEWSRYRAFHADGTPYGPGDWQMARCLTARTVNGAEEFRIQRFDDSYGTLLGSSAPVFAADGSLLGAVSVFADITHLKDIEEALRISQEQLSATLRSIGDGVIATDQRGVVTFMNAVAESLTGWLLAEALGQYIEQVVQFIDERTRAKVDNPVLSVLRDHHVAGPNDHTLLVRKGGRELHVDDKAAPINNVKGELVGVVLVFRDVSEKREFDMRQQLLAEAGVKLLSSSLEYHERLASIAQLAVPRFADWAAVDMVQQDGSLQRLAIAHSDPEKLRLAARIQQRYPTDPDTPHWVHGVIRTGEPMLLTNVPDELLVAATHDAEHLALIRAIGLHSYLCVPLKASGRTLGAITFAMAENPRAYGPRDLAFAEELALRAAFAIENALLYQEAQQQRRTAQEAETRLQILTDAIPQIVWAMTSDGEYEYLSPRWYDYTGQSTDTASVEERSKALHPDDQKRVFATTEQALKQLSGWELDYRLLGRDGSYRWFLGRAVPVLDEQGRLVKWYGTATDIDDQKRAIRSRDDLLATVSHDLRNPLGNVLMATSILKTGFTGNDEQSMRVAKQLQVLERAGRRMETLIRDLLDIAAIESGHLSMTFSEVSVSGILSEVLESALPKAREKGMHLERSELSAGMIACDRDRVLQVFENLLGNALKFTPREGLITIGVKARGDNLNFFVRNTGPGIEPHQLPHIFDRFWQAHAATRTGAGLGLAICKGIVDLHRGQIWAESEPSSGTTFWFALPAQPSV